MLLSLSPSMILSKWAGDSEKAISGVFDLAKSLQPCIIFLVSPPSGRVIGGAGWARPNCLEGSSSIISVAGWQPCDDTTLDNRTFAWLRRMRWTALASHVATVQMRERAGC
jgi:hypothetical protein